VLTFRESLENRQGNQIGPLSLRKSSAPLSVLQMSEIARTHTLSNSYRGALGSREEGHTVSLDIHQLQLSEDSSVQDVSKLVSITPQLHHLARPTAIRPNSKYLPSRPDDVNSLTHRQGKGDDVAVAVSVGGNSISRPDLIGGGGGKGRGGDKSATTRGAISNGSKAAAPSSASGLPLGNSTSAHASATGDGSERAPIHSTGGSKGSGGAGVTGSTSVDGERSSFSALKKMSNFFQRKT
jgi:hypothetical protein